MSVTVTEKAFNLVRAIESSKSDSATVWSVANHISLNGASWSTESNATTSLDQNSLMPVGGIANIYSDNAGTLPADLPELVQYCTRIARLEQGVIQSAADATDFATFSAAANDVEYQKFHKGLKTLKERLDSTIKTSADNLVNTVATYVQGQYDSMATELPVNVTEAEVQTIAAGIAEKFAEDFAAKIQEKLSELTNASGSA